MSDHSPIPMELGGSFIRHRCEHDIPPKDGRENWTVEMPVAVLRALAATTVGRSAAKVESETKELEAMRAAFSGAKLNPVSRLIRWFNYTEEGAIRVKERWVEEYEEFLAEWQEWSGFFSMMDQNATVKLTHDDFRFFFPGDFFSTISEPDAGEAETEDAA